ncbi:hypothetical protein ACJIZ3_020594 [Penstemon smallii]|uniref:Protein kinase domain-containing protein n=1 Tax=Penstemon smallii TaxID=265156 RepID=A0ABD3SJB5_9LAMI
MAFDPKDLRPLNIVRNISDDTRMAPVTSSGRPIEGFYANPPRDVGGIPTTVPAVYYPPTVPDTSFVPIGYNNAIPGVSGWLQHVVPSQPQPGLVGPAVVSSASGYTRSPKFGAQVGSNVSDHASEDGVDNSVSGRRVKFLCSFGGKILPRPSDGALRYVGGQTRIISVRRDISFVELVEKMAETYAQNVVIKYQLPEEDLDALVSVSCPDDLENMMDEYEKLIERSSDGSAKLRIFLFSPSDLESSSLVHMGDFKESGQRYVEAVNGVVDGLSGGGIARKGSIESAAASSQTSDFGGTEGADSLGHGLGEVTGLPLKENYSVPFDTAPRMAFLDPNQPAPLGIPMAQTALSTALEQEVERSVPITVPQSLPYVPTPFLDPRQETLNHPNYVQVPPPIGFPQRILGAVGPPMYTQQPIPAGASPQQFNPNMHMTMNPSFVSMRPTPVPAMVQPQQIRVEHYPAENMVAQRVVQLPVDQGYNANQAQVPTTMQGGLYNIGEGGLPPQTVMIPEKIPVLEDCFMCQKQLPHAHSDTIAQEIKQSSGSTLSDSRSIYQSLRLDNRGRPMMRPVVTGTQAEGNIEQLAGGPQPRFVGTEGQESGQYVNYDKTKAENYEHAKVMPPKVVMMTNGAQTPYGMFVGNTPQPYQANAAQHLVPQPQVQVVHDTTINKPLINDFAPSGGISMQTTECVTRESPKEYSSKVAGGVLRDDSTLLADHLRQIDGRLENLQIRPSEILPNNNQNKAAFEVTEAPPLSNPNLYPHPMLGVNHDAERNLPIGEWQDNIPWSQSKIPGNVEATSSTSPSYRVGEIPENSASLFSNQDPWSLRHDNQFPPPRPIKIQARRENARQMNSGESPTGNCKDSPLGDGAYQPSGNLNRDLNTEHVSSNKGSAEELIKQELQAVAEGVAASVLHSSVPSDAGLSAYGSIDAPSINPQNGETQNRVKFEEIKTKLPEKINLGFPASDGIGRLQIIKNSDLEELRELGSGTFGTVYHGKWRGTDVAIKRINDRCFAAKQSEQERMRDDFWNEAIKLADLHHPNVVAFYGVVLDGPDGLVSTVTEYMVNGSLRNALQKSERNLDKRKRLLIGMDVAFGMEYLHGKNIVHFDLKSDNLLVNLRDPHRPICKVGDLGLSKVKCQTLISGGVRGTLPWMAPELLNGSSSLVSEKVDVFSFGIVMWELLTGEEPYADLHYGAIIGGIVNNTLRPPVPETCDPVWRALMERCWASEPSERPKFTDIANELRAMAAKLPTKGQVQQPLPSTNPK